MIARLQKILPSEPTGQLPGFRRVTLVLIIALFLGSTALAVVQRHPSFDRWFLSVLGVNLLFQHLASQFRWRPNVRVVLGFLYLISFACMAIYFCICIWS